MANTPSSSPKRIQIIKGMTPSDLRELTELAKELFGYDPTIRELVTKYPGLISAFDGERTTPAGELIEDEEIDRIESSADQINAVREFGGQVLAGNSRRKRPVKFLGNISGKKKEEKAS